MLKSKIMSLFAGLLFAVSAFATQQGSVICPSIASAQSEGLTQTAEILEGMYLTYHQSQFDTSATWIFIMGPIMAENEENALDLGNQYLSTMSGTAEAQQDEDGNWFCEYPVADGEEHTVFAIQTDEVLSPFQMNRYLRRSH